MVLLYFYVVCFFELYLVNVLSCSLLFLFVSISQLFGCEDRPRNDVDCVNSSPTPVHVGRVCVWSQYQGGGDPPRVTGNVSGDVHGGPLLAPCAASQLRQFFYIRLTAQPASLT